jgi:hypothetical protein
MNVTGVLVSAGSVYTYFDIAAGKDQPWLGPNWTNGLEQVRQTQNGKCFNMNIGITFRPFSYLRIKKTIFIYKL